MDILINKHIDSIDELERQLAMIIDQEISQINIDEVIKSPQEALAQVVDNIQTVFLDQYADKALELGFDFGKQIAERIKLNKDIKIDDSENPNLNDTGEDSK